MSQLHRTFLFLRGPGSAWQADILGLLYNENSMKLSVIVHANTSCFSRLDMVYVEGVIFQHLVLSAGTVQQKPSRPLCWDCTAETFLPSGPYDGPSGSWDGSEQGAKDLTYP